MTIYATFKVTACAPQDATRHHALNISQEEGDRLLPTPVFDRHGKQENKVDGVVALVQRAIECAENQGELLNLVIKAGDGVCMEDVEHQVRVASDDLIVERSSVISEKYGSRYSSFNKHLVIIE